MRICIVFLVSASVSLTVLYASGNSFDSSGAFLAILASIAVSVCVVLPFMWHLRSITNLHHMVVRALDVTDTSVVLYDRNNKVTYFNGAAAKIYESFGTEIKIGVTEENLLRTRAALLFNTDEEANRWYEFAYQDRQNQKTTSDPFVVQIGDINRYNQLWLNRQEDGTVAEVRLDVTKLKNQELALAKREKDLEASRNEAQASNKAKSQFLANMSHEIRTPMNGVIGMTELLLEGSLNAEQRDYAGTISKSALALLTLINDILDFSKIEAGKFELSSDSFDLREAVEDVSTLLATSAQARNIELITDFATDLPTRFIGDAGRLRQILTNLVGNAVKFTETGHVAVHVSGADRDNCFALQFCIVDTGIGIPENKLGTVFSAFEQVDGAATRRFEGTGLGLAISQRLTQLMGGQIRVESTLGEGSTFSFEIELPLDRSFKESSERDSPISLTGKRVLVVDDLELNLQILEKRLKNWGMTPVVADSGVQAIRLAHQQAAAGKPFELAIFDYQMPEMDGHALCSYFKQEGDLKDIPILLLSSVDQAAQESQIREFGFEASLLKPVRHDALHHAITRSLTPPDRCANRLADETDSTEKTDSEFSNKASATKLLVIEDNPMNQMVVSGFLKKYQFNLELADNGALGVEAYKRNQPDLIFMDVSMPVMNGLEATSRIREYEEAAGLTHCPIVALTANAMQEDREACLQSGMDDFLTKPVLSAKLDEKLRQWLNMDEDQNKAA